MTVATAPIEATIVMQRGKLCVYNRLENGVREFVFTEPSHAAVDEWLSHLDYITRTDTPSPDGEMFAYLLDSRASGPLPMYYAFQQDHRWRSGYLRAYPNTHFRVAQLHNAPPVFVSMARNLARLFPSSHFEQEYFTDDRAAALAWLCR